MRRILPAAIVAALGAAFSYALPAAAEEIGCAPRNEVLQRLADGYGEAPVAIGIAGKGALLEVLAADKGRTWTIIVTAPSGLSCPLVAGKDWQARTPEPKGIPL